MIGSDCAEDVKATDEATSLCMLFPLKERVGPEVDLPETPALGIKSYQRFPLLSLEQVR